MFFERDFAFHRFSCVDSSEAFEDRSGMQMIARRINAPEAFPSTVVVVTNGLESPS